MNPAFRRILLETAETLAIALAGGVTFVFLGLPAGLVSGSVVAVATAALLGRPMRVPLTLARICYVVVGTLLGTVVTPETLRGVITWPAIWRDFWSLLLRSPSRRAGSRRSAPSTMPRMVPLRRKQSGYRYLGKSRPAVVSYTPVTIGAVMVFCGAK
jgi:hypothetical protein